MTLPQLQRQHEYREDNLIVDPKTTEDRSILLFPGISYQRGDVIGEIIRLDGDLSDDVTYADENAGNGVAVAEPGATMKKGIYIIVFSSATEFDVESPAGEDLGAGEIGEQFVDSEIVIDVTAGVNAFAAADEIYITVNQVESLFKKYNPEATTGEQNPHFILGQSHDLTLESSEVSSYAYTRGVFNSNYVYVETGDTLDIELEMRKVGLLLKKSVKTNEV